MEETKWLKPSDIYVRQELHSARDPAKDITIQQLEALEAEAVELEQELVLLYGEVRLAENRLKN
jgi:hypothetical protein